MPDKNESPQLLKTLFNRVVIEHIADKVTSVWPSFDGEAFIQRSLRDFENLTLKQRSAQIADSIQEYLGVDFEKAAGLLLQAMGEDNGSGGVEGLSDFAYLPYLDFVERHGLDFPEFSLKVLEQMTLFFSAEFAVRPYILSYPELAMDYLIGWSEHKDWRVRRLASEGSRPRLPWGIQLKPFVQNPAATIMILNKLYNDENLIVRRSVANHLNDIAKDHPNVVVETAKRWWRSNNDDAQWTVKHGLRTLVKKGNTSALAVLGFKEVNNISVDSFTVSPQKARIGGEVAFQFRLTSGEAESCKLVVDYALERPLANGKKAKKVFKLKTFTIAPKETAPLQAKQAFKQLSTRTYYAGTYAIEVLVNGRALSRKEFEVY